MTARVGGGIAVTSPPSSIGILSIFPQNTPSDDDTATAVTGIVKSAHQTMQLSEEQQRGVGESLALSSTPFPDPDLNKLKVFEEKDLEFTCRHEAGHMVVAEHFGLRAWARVSYEGEPTFEKRVCIGLTCFQRATAFRRAVIAWGGLVGEKPGNEMSISHGNWEEYLDDNHSETDLVGIRGHFQPYRALRLAQSILIKRSTRFTQIVEQLKINGVAPCSPTPEPEVLVRTSARSSPVTLVHSLMKLMLKSSRPAVPPAIRISTR